MPARRPKAPADGARQLDFLDAGWPDPARFPYNATQTQVRDQVLADLRASRQPLIVTGYSSLDVLIDWLAGYAQAPTPPTQIRLVLGHEPQPQVRPTHRLPNHAFDQEIADYWLNRGISLYLSAKMLVALDLVQQGTVQVRISAQPSRPIHAKIYQGDTAATLGSSNFSHAGLSGQIEANVRFTAADDPRRFAETARLAERIWDLGAEYTAGFIALLTALFHRVTWEEALARACAEVLEGTWATQYTRPPQVGDAPPLWPSQEQGIAQAMWVLEHVGSVLIADATGSGKTRMGAHLLRAIVQRIWTSGRMRRDTTVLICPPAVQDAWQAATTDTGQAVALFSEGILSHPTSERQAALLQALRRAQVLAVDEAHHFLNRWSRRTQHLFAHMADYVLLFTATPINQGAPDLIAIIDLLGADNFDEAVLEIFGRMFRRRADPAGALSPAERRILQRAIGQFTVRRTKAMLNTLIAADPDRYRDATGRPCRYPEHLAYHYRCDEPPADRALAGQIFAATLELRGLVNLRAPLQLSDSQRRDGVTEADYLQWRLMGAQGLVRHHIMASLRSSRAALVEHIAGTATAYAQFDLPGSRAHATGDMPARLRTMAGQPPTNGLTVPVPEWLADPAAHAAACQVELAVYERIVALVAHLSDSREAAKAAHLRGLLATHGLVLGFDSHPITLTDLHRRLGGGETVVVATGESPQGRQRVQHLTQFGSTATGVIALCSDAMAEGLNLQAASAVVHLDMPSVIRLAEQRIGRVDRLNSAHTRVEIYWPDDAPEFALRADERFFARHRLVADLLGANIRLPESRVVTTAEVITEFEQAEADAVPVWDEITDAFEPVRALLAPGAGLVPPAVYAQIRATTARLCSSVSAVTAAGTWAFFAIAGTEWGAPRWVYLDSPQAAPVTDLALISQALRLHLATALHREFDPLAATLLTGFLDQLRRTEAQLLPRKKQRALQEMHKILTRYRQQAIQQHDSARSAVIAALLALTTTAPDAMAVDLGSLAECWLDLIRPQWYTRLHQGRPRFRPLLLKDLRADLLATPLSTAQLQTVLDRDFWVRPLDERIVAAIIAVPAAAPL